VVRDEFTLPVGVELLQIYPHAHYLGKDMLVTARLPRGEEKTLLHIARWDLNWQAVYRYAQAVELPAGTTIAMRYVYDNSRDNLANPHDPPQRVVAGNRASDEMAHLWLQVLPVGADGKTSGAAGGLRTYGPCGSSRAPSHRQRSGRFCRALQSRRPAPDARRNAGSRRTVCRSAAPAARRLHRRETPTVPRCSPRARCLRPSNI
jgi:hypothetical protein